MGVLETLLKSIDEQQSCRKKYEILDAFEGTADDRVGPFYEEVRVHLRTQLQALDEKIALIANPIPRAELNSMIGDLLFFALITGNQSSPSRAAWVEYERRFRRNATRSANSARRNLSIDPIIKRLSEALWAQKPSFRANANGSAKNIQEAFNAELRALGNEIPKRWKPADLTDPESVKAEVDRIRKRIERILKMDD